MKKILLTVTLVSSMFSGSVARADYTRDQIISAPTLMGIVCVFYNRDACPSATSLIGTELGLLTLTTVLLKEAQEVKSDAINDASGEQATPALESVVEKIQASASEQGKEVSFDEIIEALIQSQGE